MDTMTEYDREREQRNVERCTEKRLLPSLSAKALAHTIEVEVLKSRRIEDWMRGEDES